MGECTELSLKPPATTLALLQVLSGQRELALKFADLRL